MNSVDNVILMCAPNKIITPYMEKVPDACVCRIEASVILLLEKTFVYSIEGQKNTSMFFQYIMHTLIFERPSL